MQTEHDAPGVTSCAQLDSQMSVRYKHMTILFQQVAFMIGQG